MAKSQIMSMFVSLLMDMSDTTIDDLEHAESAATDEECVGYIRRMATTVAAMHTLCLACDAALLGQKMHAGVDRLIVETISEPAAPERKKGAWSEEAKALAKSRPHWTAKLSKAKRKAFFEKLHGAKRLRKEAATTKPGAFIVETKSGQDLKPVSITRRGKNTVVAEYVPRGRMEVPEQPVDLSREIISRAKNLGARL